MIYASYTSASYNVNYTRADQFSGNVSNMLGRHVKSA